MPAPRWGDVMDDCFLCGRFGPVEMHHIFGGPYRKKSTKYGLVIPLCHFCHNEPPNGVHHNRETARLVKQYGQRVAMAENGWTIPQFIAEFGKNYLEEEEEC